MEAYHPSVLLLKIKGSLNIEDNPRADAINISGLLV